MSGINGWNYIEIVGKYKKCPNCGASYKSNKLYSELKDETIKIGCICGWEIKVDENNKEI